MIAYGRHGAPPIPAYSSPNDYTLVWWNSKAKGEDEEGTEGTGLIEYAQGGKRYKSGTVPSAPVAMFRSRSAVTTYKVPPRSSTPPSDRPWPGSPAAQA